VSADDGSPLMRVNGFAAADSLTGGRRRVSTHPDWAWESLAKIVPLPVSGRVDTREGQHFRADGADGDTWRQRGGFG
jgi:hypothetical protein